MNVNKNYYQILGLNKNATTDEIKSNFRKMAMELHPDRNKGDVDKENKFKEVSEANETLSDPNKKQQYDTQSPHGNSYNPNPFSAFGGGFGDIFSSFFGGGSFSNPFGNPFEARHEYREFNENLDININVVITLTDVYKGNPIKVSYKRFQHCEDCNGTGFNRNGHSDNCMVCGGDINKQGSGRDMYGRKCQYCQGLGKIFSETCPTCNGEKVVLKDAEFNINNIHKVRNSSEEFLREFGHQSKYFREKRGTLKLNVIYQNIPNYTIENEQLIFKLDLHYEDAIKGVKYEYPTLDDSKLLVNIPEKSNDGDIIRLKGKGLFKTVNDRDDLFFKINIVINYDKI